VSKIGKNSTSSKEVKAKSGKSQSTEPNSERDFVIQCDKELGRKEDEVTLFRTAEC